MSSPRSHGLDGSMTVPDWPPLTLDELRPVLSAYPALGAPEAITFRSPRPFSAAAVVRTGLGPIFVKRHGRSIRGRAGLAEEHRFLDHLREHGAPVPRVLATASGETAVGLDRWSYEVHELAAGVDAYRDAFSWTPFRSPAHARAAGQALARLHRASVGFAAPRRAVQPLVASFTIFADADPAAAMQAYLAARPRLANHANIRRCAVRALEILAPFHAELRPLLPQLAPLWTHNDLHASNLLWSGPEAHAQATSVIDFGWADRTNAIYDLAQTIGRNIVEWLVLVNHPEQPDAVPVHFDHLDALLAGYASVRSLSRAEALALAPMMALCHAEVALSEADYFLHLTQRAEEQAVLAYDGWLVGHARWWTGAAGRRLLDALRRWAER